MFQQNIPQYKEALSSLNLDKKKESIDDYDEENFDRKIEDEIKYSEQILPDLETSILRIYQKKPNFDMKQFDQSNELDSDLKFLGNWLDTSYAIFSKLFNRFKGERNTEELQKLNLSIKNSFDFIHQTCTQLSNNEIELSNEILNNFSKAFTQIYSSCDKINALDIVTYEDIVSDTETIPITKTTNEMFKKPPTDEIIKLYEKCISLIKTAEKYHETNKDFDYTVDMKISLTFLQDFKKGWLSNPVNNFVSFYKLLLGITNNLKLVQTKIIKYNDSVRRNPKELERLIKEVNFFEKKLRNIYYDLKKNINFTVRKPQIDE